MIRSDSRSDCKSRTARWLSLALLATVLALPAALPARAQSGLDDETRERVLLTLQSRGHLAPGTRPKCFPAGMNETVTAGHFRCPWDRPNGQPRLPSAQSLWGILGNY